MGLTRGEAEYVDEMESLVVALKSEIGSSARRLIQQRLGVTKKAAHELYLTTYGEGMDDDLAVELAKIDTTINALFTAGFVNQTRPEIEGQIHGANMPPPPMPPPLD